MHYYDPFKRALDILVGSAAFVVSLPVQCIVGHLVKQKLGPPVLFRQERPGKDGEIFELVKFRSMLHPDANHVTDAERLTQFGRFLRSTSLDELPSLWNVIKGDMSIVGPRPLRVHYLPLYNSKELRRHEVRPGMTGLAQVKGRNLLTWQERFELDVMYVDKRSLALDLNILKRTVWAVVQRSGISAPGEATMTPFIGTQETL